MSHDITRLQINIGGNWLDICMPISNTFGQLSMEIERISQHELIELRQNSISGPVLDEDALISSINVTDDTIYAIAATGGTLSRYPADTLLIAVTAFLFGIIMAISFVLVIYTTSMRQFALYAILLITFHFLEFSMTATFRPTDLSWSSYLLDHSQEYSIAFVASMIEYWLEFLLFPRMKSGNLAMMCVLVGGIICITGQVFRTGAMFSAKSNFTHKIAIVLRPAHVLVQDGFYGWVRHPSYFGWFWWSVGTQILLGNPVCTFLFAYASWSFFKERIDYEESFLVRFFGFEYVNYRQKVKTGIPFIN